MHHGQLQHFLKKKISGDCWSEKIESQTLIKMNGNYGERKLIRVKRFRREIQIELNKVIDYCPYSGCENRPAGTMAGTKYFLPTPPENGLDP